MAISIFPVAVTSSTPKSYSSTITTANLQYKAVQSLDAGVYIITTSSTGSQATITFYDATGASFATATTSSGTLTYNLASAATGYYIQTDTGSNIVVTVELSGSGVTGTQISGTLDTVTASGTYNQTGLLYVLACAGGRGGSGTGQGGHAGAGGSIASGFVFTNGATTVTIGAQGNGGTANTVGNAGGETSFGNLVVAPFAGGAGGGAGGGNGAQGALGIVVSGSITNSTNAGGSGGKNSQNGQNVAGRVGGFGTGGTGGDGGTGNTQAGGAASGYGAGGGGAGLGNSAQGGGNGTAGVIYVLRGI